MIESAVDDSHRTIAARALNKVKSSTFIILKNDHDTVGMGIFIAPDLAVTSNHVVVEVEDPDNIFALLPAEKQKLKLTCQFRDYRYDYAILPFPLRLHCQQVNSVWRWVYCDVRHGKSVAHTCTQLGT